MHYWAGSETGNLENAQWFAVRIAWPKRTGEILIMMREFSGYLNQGTLAISEDSIFTTVLDTAVTKMDWYGWGDGANMLDVAMHYIYRSILEENDTKLIRIKDYLTPRLTNHIKADYSFHEHGSQMHIASYASVFANATTKLSHYLAGSPAAFDLNDENFETFVNMIRYYIINGMRGHYWDYSGLGRGISGENGIKSSWTYSIKKLAESIDTANADYYLGIVKRIKGNKPPSYLVTGFNRHYWESDYTQHIRPDFNFSIRNVSTRTSSTEMAGDGGNLRGNFLSNGATNILVDGDEYYNVPVI
ncbi:MAG: hypothetical protein HRT71_19880 [Flavobacteriales bacterium]|nr:hypothetical protein [Flavobacteriales bacterium]